MLSTVAAITRFIVKGRMLPRSSLLSTQKMFYDSQSGGFIAVPGSGGIRVHDSWYAPRRKTDGVSDIELVGYMRDAVAAGVASLSIPCVTDLPQFRKSVQTSVDYLQRNRTKLPLQVAAQVWNIEQATVLTELSKQTPLSEVFMAEASVHCDRSSDQHFLTDLAAAGIQTRVNLAIDIEPLVSSSAGREVKSVIEVGNVLAGLCDQGVRVINLTLACPTETTALGLSTDGFSEDQQERIADYLREIVEEGLNLDVSGNSLLERLSVQLPSSRVLPGVADLVTAAGLSRVTVHGLRQSGTATESDGTHGWAPQLFTGGDKSGESDSVMVLVAALEDAATQAVLGKSGR